MVRGPPDTAGHTWPRSGFPRGTEHQAVVLHGADHAVARIQEVGLEYRGGARAGRPRLRVPPHGLADRVPRIRVGEQQGRAETRGSASDGTALSPNASFRSSTAEGLACIRVSRTASPPSSGTPRSKTRIRYCSPVTDVPARRASSACRDAVTGSLACSAWADAQNDSTIATPRPGLMSSDSPSCLAGPPGPGGTRP